MVNTVCFDKTGTLTENDLELLGIIGIENNSMKKNLITLKNSIF